MRKGKNRRYNFREGVSGMKTMVDDWKKHRNAIKARIVQVLMVIFDFFAVNCAYFMALVLRYYVTFEFNPNAVKFVDIFQQVALFTTALSVLPSSMRSGFTAQCGNLPVCGI